MGKKRSLRRVEEDYARKGKAKPGGPPPTLTAATAQSAQTAQVPPEPTPHVAAAQTAEAPVHTPLVAAAQTTTAPALPTPVVWVEFKAYCPEYMEQHGENFYYNPETDENSWLQPECYRPATEDEQFSYLRNNPSWVEASKKAWKLRTYGILGDKPYWYNVRTNEHRLLHPSLAAALEAKEVTKEELEAAGPG